MPCVAGCKAQRADLAARLENFEEYGGIPPEELQRLVRL